MRNIYLLGAAGSIGQQTLDIIHKDKKNFQLIGLSLGSDDKVNRLILSRFKPEIICARTKKQMENYQREYPGLVWRYGDLGLSEIARYPVPGLLVNALSGSAGLYPTIEAICAGKDIALANKETLVMAGDLITKLVKEKQVLLYPIDSEHSALWQTIDHENVNDISKIVITASGGAFRDLGRKSLITVKPKDALKHPNWSMGAKITIDSATMMNKGLEVIEAHHLFALPYDKIETVLHKESIVHGLTYFKDGTIKAAMSIADMRIPITYALYYPKRGQFDGSLKLTDLSFKPMNFLRFPLLKLAYNVGMEGGLLPTVMNAANEAAVWLFLKKKIAFLDIEKIVFKTVESFENIKHPTLEEIIETDRKIQQQIIADYEKR